MPEFNLTCQGNETLQNEEEKFSSLLERGMKILDENLSQVKNNILPGSQITVKEVAEYRGVVTVDIKDKKVTLGLGVTKLIYLCDKCICGEICLKIKN